MSKKVIVALVAAGAAAGAAAFVAWGLFKAANPPLPPLQGQMEARTVDVAGKVPGRIEKISVREGDRVEKGQAVALLSLPEVDAKLSQVKAVNELAAAKKSLVDEGARPQQIAAARAQLERARAAEMLARKTYARVASLFRDGLVSAQKHDEARAQMTAAVQQAKAAAEQLSIAETGARSQEKEQAAAAVRQAQGGLAEVQSYSNERKLLAPRNAEVDRIILTEGEIAPAGFPVIRLTDLSDMWLTLNMRETDMKNVKIGAKFKGEVVALGKTIEFSVYYISPRADYATWRSTRMSTGFDVRSFEVRARTTESIEGLRPGMSVLVRDLTE